MLWNEICLPLRSLTIRPWMSYAPFSKWNVRDDQLYQKKTFQIIIFRQLHSVRRTSVQPSNIGSLFSVLCKKNHLCQTLDHGRTRGRYRKRATGRIWRIHNGKPQFQLESRSQNIFNSNIFTHILAKSPSKNSWNGIYRISPIFTPSVWNRSACQLNDP